MRPLPELSRLLRLDVQEHEHITGGWDTTILLEPKYAVLLEPIKYRGRFRPFRQAQAIYFLLHEVAHTKQAARKEVYSRALELEANSYAAYNFQWFCQREFKFTAEQTRRLWLSLPEWYRHPTNI